MNPQNSKSPKDDGFADVVTLGQDQPLQLDSGEKIGPFEVAYKCWGQLNADKSNAVLVCHALTGDHHVRGVNPITGKAGWWENMIGPGKAVDSDHFFVICINVLGSCAGTTLSACATFDSGRRLRFPKT